jgi:hypothetical protein
MFVGQFEKHWPGHPPLVVAANVAHGDSPGITWFDYSKIPSFSAQYLAGLCFVTTPYALTLQEDFLMYDDVDEAAIREAIESIAGNYYSAVRLIDSGVDLEYSMQASIWKTRGLRCLYAEMDAATPWQAEQYGDDVMLNSGMMCKKRDDAHLPMRGRDHRDSPIFPYIATALVKGKWNSEYRVELELLHREYGIDANIRGWSA